jgi:hypothetical protein
MQKKQQPQKPKRKAEFQRPLCWHEVLKKLLPMDDQISYAVYSNRIVSFKLFQNLLFI